MPAFPHPELAIDVGGLFQKVAVTGWLNGKGAFNKAILLAHAGNGNTAATAHQVIRCIDIPAGVIVTTIAQVMHIGTKVRKWQAIRVRTDAALPINQYITAFGIAIAVGNGISTIGHAYGT